MTQFERDPRNKLLSEPLDLNSVLTTKAGAQYDPELSLERGSVEITKLENGGRLPPLPQTENDLAHCHLAFENYVHKLPYEHERAMPRDFMLHTSGFCFPEGRSGAGPTLQFLVKFNSASSRDRYCSSTGLGLFRYSMGPVATQVSCPASRASDFWDTPIFSLGAYREDIARVQKFKEELARGKGEPSFVFSGVMHALGNHLGLETIPPERIRLVAVDRWDAASSSIRVDVAPHGCFKINTKICSTTWRILMSSPHKD